MMPSLNCDVTFGRMDSLMRRGLYSHTHLKRHHLSLSLQQSGKTPLKDAQSKNKADCVAILKKAGGR